jgi:catechol 2,3-dioxygenase-like lactoylglutathione lyase family enzyme
MKTGLISHLDHLVLTVASIECTLSFYSRILGFEIVNFGDNRRALTFGNQKINLHEIGTGIYPRASIPTAGAADLCFVSTEPLDSFISHLMENEIEIEVGPVKRAGACSELMSVYFRDPDKNIIEVSTII